MVEESVISFIVRKLMKAVDEEAIFLGDVSTKLDRLRLEFRSIEGLLETVHALRFENPSTRIWIADVRDVAYDVDDILDAFFLKVASQKERGFVSRVLNIRNVHSIGGKVDAIFRIIDDITIRKNRYSLSGHRQAPETGETSSFANNEVSLRRVFSNLEDPNDIVGLEKEKDTLVRELMKEEESLRVVSICGMGGLGKSTLAKVVYNSVKSEFDCHAWFFLSHRPWKTDEVLRAILRQVFSPAPPNPQWKEMKEPELVVELRAFLEQKHYLVVLDDVWSLDNWIMLKPAFPKGTRGSKVMITTRNKKIAAEADPRHLLFEPRLLDEEEAWSLLHKKSSPTGTSREMLWFQKCGRAMLEKCGGLPLAIEVLGKILATKSKLFEWESVSEDIYQCIYQDQGDLLTSLGMSYIDLPFHLKPLFLYMGLFPGHWEIPANNLIQMWSGECLTSDDYHQNQLTKGRQYLDELIERCVVQVCERNLHGTVKTCKLHDIMREFCIRKAVDENFLKIIGKRANQIRSSSSHSSLSGDKLRRCAIYVEQQRYVFPRQYKPHLRSAIFLVGPFVDLKIEYKDFKLVKVLEFNGVKFPDRMLEKEFFKVLVLLVNLRYLGLRNTDIQGLPRSIGRLALLETLDARSISSTFLFPKQICKLTSLKHFYPCKHGSPKGMHKLVGLRVLRSIRADTWTEQMVELVNLEKLGVIELESQNLVEVVRSLVVVQNFKNLRSLALSMSSDIPFSPILESLSQKHHLLKLSLTGAFPSKITSFPSAWPSKIVKLKLFYSRVRMDPMPVLECLQHLAHLSLNQTYVGDRMVCSNDGFPQLQYLEIVDLPELVVWSVGPRAIQCLRTSVVNRCSRLGMIPHGFRSIKALQKLVIRGMPEMFCARVIEGGEDWDSVRHISSVTTE